MRPFHSRLGYLLAACLLICAADLAVASDGDAAHAYRRGYNLILDENWQGAIAAFDELIQRHPASDWVDDAAFWRCYARQQLDEAAAELFDCYERLLERYPSSEWQDDARRAMVRLAQKLDREGRPEYREKVRDFGQDENTDRLLAILVALGEIGDERSVRVILERLESTEDEQLRARIVEALEDIESDLALEKLQALLRDDPSELVRRAALETLADHDDFDSAPLLRGIINDPDQPLILRLEALDNLGNDEPPGLLHFLKEIAVGENEDLALEAIDEIGNVEIEEAVQVLAEIMATSPSYERRIEVLDSLEDLEYDSATRALLEVARNDPDPRIRREATQSLGEMETEGARDALIKLLQEMDN